MITLGNTVACLAIAFLANDPFVWVLAVVAIVAVGYYEFRTD